MKFDRSDRQQDLQFGSRKIWNAYGYTILQIDRLPSKPGHRLIIYPQIPDDGKVVNKQIRSRVADIILASFRFSVQQNNVMCANFLPHSTQISL